MAKKMSLAQRKKYDVNHKILGSLAILESRIILFSLVKKAKTAEELAVEENLPQSSVYKKLGELEELGLVYVDNAEKTSAGRTKKLYQSRISGVT